MAKLIYLKDLLNNAGRRMIIERMISSSSLNHEGAFLDQLGLVGELVVQIGKGNGYDG